MTDPGQGDGSEPLLVRRYLHSPVRGGAATRTDVRWPAGTNAAGTNAAGTNAAGGDSAGVYSVGPNSAGAHASGTFSAGAISTVAPPAEPLPVLPAAVPAIYGSPPAKRRRGVVLAAAGAIAAAGLATAGYVVFAPAEPGDRAGALPQAASTSPPAGALAAPDTSADDDAPAGEPTQTGPEAPDDDTAGDSAEQGSGTGQGSDTGQGDGTATPRQDERTTAPGTPAGQAPSTPAQQTKGPLLLAPPPAAAAPAARTGRIVADDGRCLDLFANNPADGNRVQVFTCNGTQAQNFTLATDGTLRVRDRCTDVTRRAGVGVTGCDDRDVTHWRIGANGTLASASSGRCLTRPPAGRASVSVERCSGSATQRWTLPG